MIVRANDMNLSKSFNPNPAFLFIMKHIFSSTDHEHLCVHICEILPRISNFYSRVTIVRQSQTYLQHNTCVCHTTLHYYTKPCYTKPFCRVCFCQINFKFTRSLSNEVLYLKKYPPHGKEITLQANCSQFLVRNVRISVTEVLMPRFQ